MQKYVGIIIALIFICTGKGVSAETFSEPFAQNFPYNSYSSADTQYIGNNNPDPAFWTIEIKATTTLKTINSIRMPLCLNSTSTGSLSYEFWGYGTTTQTGGVLLATGNYDLSNLIAYGGNCTGTQLKTVTIPLVQATTTSYYIFNGQKAYIVIKRTGSAVVYYAHKLKALSDIKAPFYPDGNSSTYGNNGGGQYYDTWIALGSGSYALSQTVTNHLIDAFNPELPECSITKLGGCISYAGVWLFYPDKELLNDFKNINLASTSPFGYAYDTYRAISGFQTSTSSSFKLTLDFNTLNSEFGTSAYSTSSVTVFDVCWVNNGLGEFGGNAYRDYIMPLWVALLWLGFLFELYVIAHKIF